jgi:hypothetical protein
MICPACKANLGLPLNRQINVGDLSFCPICAEMLLLGADMEMRLPSPEEANAVREDPQVRWIESVMRKRAERR